MRQAKIVMRKGKPKGQAYRIQFRDPLPGDTVVLKLDKPNKNGEKYVEVVLGEKVGRNEFLERK